MTKGGVSFARRLGTPLIGDLTYQLIITLQKTIDCKYIIAIIAQNLVGTSCIRDVCSREEGEDWA